MAGKFESFIRFARWIFRFVLIPLCVSIYLVFNKHISLNQWKAMPKDGSTITLHSIGFSYNIIEIFQRLMSDWIV